MRRTPMKDRVLHKKRKMILAVILLAAFCLVVTELAVCRVVEPALYLEITAPARACVRTVKKAASAAGHAAARGTARLASAAGQAITDTAHAAREMAADAAARAEKAMAPKVTVPHKQAAGRGLPETQLAGPTVPLASPNGIVDESVSHLEGRESLEFLTGGGIEVVYYNQTDGQWSETSYGADPLNGYGCGPTAMSMVVSTLLQRAVDPAQMAQECVNRGYWARRSGSYLSIVQGIADAYGLECTSIPPEQLDKDNLLLHLSNGDLAVALMTRGHFTGSGHFIVLRGLTLDGSILVADPASRERSLTPWDLSLILSELSPSRHDGAPLWLISPPSGLN